MIVEVTRLVDRWLKHPMYGMEAMLAGVSRQTPEGTTEDAPPVPVIYNDTESEEIANGQAPPTSPAIVLFVDADVTMDTDNRSRQIARGAIVSIGYVTQDEPPLVAAVNAGYTLRAVKKSLTAYNSQTLSTGYRELNGIKIVEVSEVAVQNVGGGVGTSRLWGFVLATLKVIDLEP